MTVRQGQRALWTVWNDGDTEPLHESTDRPGSRTPSARPPRSRLHLYPVAHRRTVRLELTSASPGNGSDQHASHGPGVDCSAR